VAIIDHGFHAEDPGLQHVHLTAAFSVDGRAPVTSRAALPPHYHGTFCAGLVGANGADVHGAAPDCELILVAAPPHAVLSDVIMGAMLQYSADQGADVISCSLGPNSADWPLTPTLKPAIDYVGNTGRAGKGIPLAFASPDANLSMAANSVNAYGRLLSISQCDRTGQRVVSGFGPGLAFLAPGFRVAGILWENGTRTIGTMTGASLAAPCAAGVAALVLAVRQDLTWQQVINVLTQSCDPAAAGKQRNDDVGWGVLNAERAVRMAIAHP
jgi:thermitase